MKSESKATEQVVNPHKPYSADWWKWKGRYDRRDFGSPQFPKVKPYMEGWHDVEDEDRDAYGDTDFINE